MVWTIACQKDWCQKEIVWLFNSMNVAYARVVALYYSPSQENESKPMVKGNVHRDFSQRYTAQEDMEQLLYGDIDLQAEVQNGHGCREQCVYVGTSHHALHAPAEQHCRRRIVQSSCRPQCVGTLHAPSSPPLHFPAEQHCRRGIAQSCLPFLLGLLLL